MASSSPVRVGLIGLGKTVGEFTPGSWGATVHLPYLLASPKYKLVAVANSSVKSAEESIAIHKLGPEVKAYGSPEDIANDPNVDLVVISVVITHHYNLTKPALLAGKDVFVEWPLASTTAEAEELTKLAESNGVRTIVGAQGRGSPLLGKLKELVGGIGKITSTTVVSSFQPIPSDFFFEDAKYYLDINSGGNCLTIYLGHFFENFIHTLGNFSSLNSILRNYYPTVKLISNSGEVTAESYPRNTPSHISILGTLASGATASITYRTTSPSVEPIGLRWLITGTEGEIEVTTPEGQWQSAPTDKIVTKVRTGKEGEAKVVDLMGGRDEADVIKGLRETAKNTARLYEAFDRGERGSYLDFREATEVQKVFDEIRNQAGEEWKVKN